MLVWYIPSREVSKGFDNLKKSLWKLKKMEIQGYSSALNYYVAQCIDVVILGERGFSDSAGVVCDGESHL